MPASPQEMRFMSQSINPSGQSQQTSEDGNSPVHIESLQDPPNLLSIEPRRIDTGDSSTMIQSSTNNQSADSPLLKLNVRPKLCINVGTNLKLNKDIQPALNKSQESVINEKFNLSPQKKQKTKLDINIMSLNGFPTVNGQKVLAVPPMQSSMLQINQFPTPELRNHKSGYAQSSNSSYYPMLGVQESSQLSNFGSDRHHNAN